MLATGGGASFATSLPTGWELGLSARVERQRSVMAQAKSDVNDFFGGDGIFPENAPVTEGTFGGGSVSLSGTIPFRWSVTADALGGEGLFTGRFFGEIRRSFGGRARRYDPRQGGDRHQHRSRADAVPRRRCKHGARVRLRHAPGAGVLGDAARHRPDPRADPPRALRRRGPRERAGRSLRGPGAGGRGGGAVGVRRTAAPGSEPASLSRRRTLRFDVTAGAPR